MRSNEDRNVEVLTTSSTQQQATQAGQASQKPRREPSRGRGKGTGPARAKAQTPAASDTAATKRQKKARPILTQEEQAELKREEAIIEKGLASFTEIGPELEKIRERKLYRGPTRKTWAAYIRQRWGMTKTHADRLIAAAKLAREKLTPAGVIFHNEHELRPLVKQPQDQFERAMEKGCKAAKVKKIPLTTKLLVEQLPKPPKQKKGAGALFRLPARFTKTLESAKAIRDDVAQAIKNTAKDDQNLAILKKVREFLDTLKREMPTL